MFLGLKLGVTALANNFAPGIVVVTPPYLNPALLRVGDTLSGAYVAGSYTWTGGAVTEGAPAYTVNGVSKAGSYVLIAGDIVAAAAVGLTASGAPSITVYAEPTDITDFSYTTSDFEYTVPAGAGDSTAPTISNPTATANGATAIDGTVDTNEGNGILWAIAYDSAHTAPSAANVKAGNDGSGAALKADSFTVTATGTQSITLTGVTGASSYKVAYAHEDVYGNMSNVSIISGTITLVVAPTLSSPTASTVKCTSASIGVTTDKSTGTLYGILSTSATAPTAAQIKAGQNHTGAAATWAGNQSISSTGAKSFTPTGLTPGSTLYAHFTHYNGMDSNVASASAVTTKIITKIGSFFNDTSAQTHGATYSLDLTTPDTTNGGIGGSLQQDDIIIFNSGWASTSDDNPGVAGITSEVADQYANATQQDTNQSVGYLVCSASPPSSVTVTGSNNAANGALAIAVAYRYVDPVTPMDVAAQVGVLTASTVVDAGAITPTSVGAKIVAALANSGDTTPVLSGTPSNMSLVERRSNGGSTRGVAFLLADADGTAGVAFDPGSSSNSEDTSARSGAWVTLALRPN